MSRAQSFASGFVTCLAAVSIACGGGGGASGPELETDAQGVCLAQTVAGANTLIDAVGAVRCRFWSVAGVRVYGASYPDFLIGGEE